MSAFAGDAIYVDEIGIEIGAYGDFRLKTAYQPIFTSGLAELTPVAVEGSMAAFREGQPVSAAAFFKEILSEDVPFVESMCRALHLRNRPNIGVPWLDLFFSYDPRVDGDLQKSLAGVVLSTSLIHEVELAPARLICEIDEATALDQDTLIAVAGEMRRRGMRIALDHGEAGHSAFERISQLRPDIVRINGGWFRRLCEEDSTARLFGPIAAAFRQLGSKVLVEGIETAAQLRVAIEGRADLVQGFLLAPPALAGTIFDEASRSLERLLDAPDKVVPLFGKHQRR